MKILLVHNSYQQHGGEDIVFEQEKYMLRQAGHEVTTYIRSNLEGEQYPGPRRLQLAVRTIWSNESARDFRTCLEQNAPDLVHVHNTFFMLSPSIFSACRHAGIPVVNTLHNYRMYCPAATFFRDGHPCEECVDHGLWRGIAHSCYRDSRLATATVALMLTVHRHRHTWTRDINNYIALTEFARTRFVRAGLPPHKVFVKPNFVYPDPEVDWTATREYALFVGRLSDARMRTLLGAWQRLPHIPLVVIGGGPQLDDMRRQAASQGLANIHFAGHLPRQKAVEAMRKARFLVFSSEWYENFPVTIAESFACGVPVICSRLGAMEEIVDDGRTGLHFNPGDALDLAAKVAWAWSHEDHMRSMGSEARSEYTTRYTAEHNYPRLMDIYHHALRGDDTCQVGHTASSSSNPRSTA